MYDELSALHEAGHAVAADALGCKVRLVTIEPGERWGGICRYLPPLVVRGDLPRSVETTFVTWPSGWQRELAAGVVISLAGGQAAELFAPRGTASVRLPENASEKTLERLAELAEATPAELAEAADAVNSPSLSDDEYVAKVAWAAHGNDDLHCSAAWLNWLIEETRRLLRQHEQAVRRMAALLLQQGTIGEAAAAACLRGELGGNG